MGDHPEHPVQAVQAALQGPAGQQDQAGLLVMEPRERVGLQVREPPALPGHRERMAQTEHPEHPVQVVRQEPQEPLEPGPQAPAELLVQTVAMGRVAQVEPRGLRGLLVQMEVMGHQVLPGHRQLPVLRPQAVRQRLHGRLQLLERPLLQLRQASPERLFTPLLPDRPVRQSRQRLLEMQEQQGLLHR